MPFTAAEIAKQLQGEVIGDASATLAGFAPADSAKPGDLTFAENEDYFARAEQSAATATPRNTSSDPRISRYSAMRRWISANSSRIFCCSMPVSRCSCSSMRMRGLPAAV